MKVLVLTIASVLALCGGANADVSISGKPTSNMSCEAGVCTATAQKAVLNVADLATMLASGDVAVKTGSIAKDINISQTLTWSSTSRLTLDAQQSVTLKKQITVAGQGALTVTINDTGAKAKNKTGEFIIVPEHGSVQFWDLSSNLMIDGNGYTLVGDIKTLASDIAANSNGRYALAKSYDASGDGTYEDSPVHKLKAHGVIEGLGNSISNLSISSIKSAALLTNNAGALLDLKVFGSISSERFDSKEIYVAGLTSRNSGKISNCSFGGSVEVVRGYSYVGALAARNTGTILQSRAAGTVNGIIVGGIAGANAGMISLSQAAVTTSGGGAGGLIGENAGLIDRSFASGAVSADSVGGGLVGYGYSSGEIVNSYATGSTTGDDVGGLAGGTDSTVATSYSTGKVSATGARGGFVGNANGGAFTYGYWDIDTSGQTEGCGLGDDCPGVIGFTDMQLKSQLPDGFDPKVWGQAPNINNGYPYLLANPPR